MHFAAQGTATPQIDDSGWGNHGTVTAATKTPHPPFLDHWQRFRARRSADWIAEDAGGGGSPTLPIGAILRLGVGR